MLKKLFSIFLSGVFLVSSLGTAAAEVPNTANGKLGAVETVTYGQEQTGAIVERIKKLEKDYPGLVLHTRGFGMLCAFDLKDGETRDKFASYAMNTEHMIMLGCGTQSIRFRPVLDVKREDLEEGFRRIRRVLDAIK